MRRGTWLLATSFLAALPRPAAAQSAADLIALGVRAYQHLDYEQAAAVLRRSLLRAGDDSIIATARLEALMYVGATEVFRGRSDSATAAFRQLVVLDPTYRPNGLIFPPQVTDLFGGVREATKAVTARMPPVAELRVPADRYVIPLRATSPHEINVALTKSEGTPIRVLYDGPIADSLAVAWDGLTETGGLAADGRYVDRGPAAARLCDRLDHRAVDSVGGPGTRTGRPARAETRHLRGAVAGVIGSRDPFDGAGRPGARRGGRDHLPAGAWDVVDAARLPRGRCPARA